MTKVRVGFVRNKAFFVPLAWAIELFSWTRYHHIYVGFNDHVFDTTLKSGTKFSTREDFLKAYEIIEDYEFELSEADFQSLLAFSSRYEGVAYGFKQLFGTLLAKILGTKKNLLSQGTSAVTCAELTLLMIRALPKAFGDSNLLSDQDPDTVGLRTLHKFLKESPKGKRV